MFISLFSLIPISQLFVLHQLVIRVNSNPHSHCNPNPTHSKPPSYLLPPEAQNDPSFPQITNPNHSNLSQNQVVVVAEAQDQQNHSANNVTTLSSHHNTHPTTTSYNPKIHQAKQKTHIVNPVPPCRHQKPNHSPKNLQLDSQTTTPHIPTATVTT